MEDSQTPQIQSANSTTPSLPSGVPVPEGVEHQPAIDLHPESFRRIQACLIACEGITTEELESGIIQEMRQTLRELVPILQTMRRSAA